MPITFQHDNDVIVYVLEKVISYARANQYIFLAQCVWWISSILELQQGLVIHIDNLQKQADKTPVDIISDKTNNYACLPRREVSATPRGIQEDSRFQNETNQTRSDETFQLSDTEDSDKDRQDRILQECEEFIGSSRRQRRITLLKKSGKTISGRVNPSNKPQKSFRVKRKKSYKEID